MTSVSMVPSVLLVILCFLYDLNLYLRGHMRAQVEMALVLAILADLAATFFAAGWRMGLLAVVATFPLTWIMMPLARALARRLVGRRTGIALDTGSLDWEGLVQEGGLDAVIEASQEERSTARRRLEALALRPKIRRVLERQRVTLEEFEALHDMLAYTLLADITWEILSEADELERVLLMHREGRTPGEIWSEVAL